MQVIGMLENPFVWLTIFLNTQMKMAQELFYYLHTLGKHLFHLNTPPLFQPSAYLALVLILFSGAQYSINYK